MIISRAEIESAISAYRTSPKRKPRVDAPPYGTDRYEHSTETTFLPAFAQRIFSEPFYRSNLVSDLQRRISEGKYYVPAEHIVEKLLGRLFAEALPA